MTDRDVVTTATPDGGERDALAQLIRAAGRRPAPRAADYERVWAASHAAWQSKLRASRRRRALWYALAAAAVVAAVGLIVAPRWTPEPDIARVALLHGRLEAFAAEPGRWQPLAAGAAIAAGTRVRTAASSRAAFALARGVSLRADSGTEWIFDSAAQLTLTAGTLYLDTGGAGHDVEIATAHGVVRDIGTQFEVHVSSELRLRVREGRVELQQRAVPAALEAVAGDELRVRVDGAVERSRVATDGAEWQWAQTVAAPLELDGRTAFEVLQWVARETGKRLIFEDANAELRARGAIVHGSSLGLEPLQVLDVVVATSTGFDYTLGEGTLVIRRR